MKEYKNQLKEYYNKFADERDASIKRDWKLRLRNEFLAVMKERGYKTLLEIGAGTGQDSHFFKENGLVTTSVDLSEEHIKSCVKRGLNAQVMDFSDMEFDDEIFDCMYAMNCLLHVPNSEIVSVLKEIKRVIKKEGLLFICQYGGNNEEGIMANGDKGERFFSFRTMSAFAAFADEAGLKQVCSGTIDIGVEGHESHYFIFGK